MAFPTRHDTRPRAMGAHAAAAPFPGFLVVAIDFETTGLSPARDRVVQVGAVAESSSGALIFELNELVYTPVRIQARAQEITGISNADLCGRPEFGAVFRQLMGKVDDARRSARALSGAEPKVLLVAHNGFRFDFRMLIYEMSRHGLPLQALRERGVHLCDTYTAACQVNGRRAGANTLSALYQRVTGQEMQGAHDALADCRALVRIARHPPFVQAASDQIVSLDAWLSQVSPLRGLDLFCRRCTGNVWDNRIYNATASTRRPDLRCQQNTCAWLLWTFRPPADNGAGIPDVAGPMAPTVAPAPSRQVPASATGESRGAAPGPQGWGVCRTTNAACKRCLQGQNCKYKGKLPGHAPADT